DKPPVSQWVMSLSGQLFGFSSASMMIPQALMAVAALALLYGAVMRVSGRPAGLLAGAALALTPVAALMFRFNNPDAVMVLLMMAAAYCTMRALQRATVSWMAWAGAALGFAFLGKMLEGLMVAPALALAYLIAAPTSFRRRLLHLGAGLIALIASAGWFVLVTLWWPASSRPYIAGSTDNNFMNLVLGYNGFARVLGHNHGFFANRSVIGQAAGNQVVTGNHGFGGDQSRGLARLFSGEFGFEIGWLLPAALLAIVLVIVARGRAPRTDLVRAAVIVFGGWAVVDGLVLSFMSGMIHAYYCLSIAPAVAAMFAIGVHEMWQRRASRFGRAGLASMLLTTGVWSFWLLRRNADWLPPLRWILLVLVVVATIALLVVAAARPRLALASVAIALTGAFAGAAAYTVATIGQPHSGGGPSVGPPSSDAASGHGWGQIEDNPELDEMLAATDTEWSAAVDRSSAAAGLELSSHTAVMAIGGFSGRDPVPTLEQFIDDVHNHRIGYYVVEDTHGHGFWGAGRHPEIARWVRQNYPATKVGSATVYDLSNTLSNPR
ncbi:MAG: glycosyltransferase family 39 protein, partial [Mycolicibacterium sp.]|nr:glycosyltransferase family 39 protein [Mycolicibacterium sp.]